MLLLYSAARLAGFCSSLNDAPKDLEAGDLFEGNTTEPKERSLQTLSQASKTTRFYFIVLIVLSALNACAPNDRTGNVLARLALFFSLSLYAATFVATWRDSRTPHIAAATVNFHGFSTHNFVQYVNSFVVAVSSSIILLVIASHVHQPLSLPSIGLSRQRQSAVNIAFSKQPFGLEREMAKSASMALRAQEQKLAALVGAAKTESDAEQSDGSEAVANEDLPGNVVAPKNTPVKGRESYLDAVGDAPPIESGSLYATAPDHIVQLEVKGSDAGRDQDVENGSSSTQLAEGPFETSQKAPRAIGHDNAKVGDRESSRSLKKDIGSISHVKDMAGESLKFRRDASPAASTVVLLPGPQLSDDHSNGEGSPKREEGEERASKDSAGASAFAVSQESQADMNTTAAHEPRSEFDFDREVTTDNKTRSALATFEKTISLSADKTLKELVVETQDDDTSTPTTQYDRKSDYVPQGFEAALPAIAKEQTIAIGPLPTNAEKI